MGDTEEQGDAGEGQEQGRRKQREHRLGLPASGKDTDWKGKRHGEHTDVNAGRQAKRDDNEQSEEG